MMNPRVRKILIADEREEYRERYTEILRDLFRVAATGAASFGDAVAIFDRHRYDLVIIGEKLTQGDGLTLVRELRKTSKRAIIVYIGIHQPKMLEEAKKAGANEAILKTPWILNTDEARTNLFIRLGLFS